MIPEDKPLPAKQNRDIIACGRCGVVNDITSKTNDITIHCQRCNGTLINRNPLWENRFTALILTSVILFICSNSFHFISIETNFSSVSVNLLSGVLALMKDNQYTLALLVFITIFIFPLVELVALSYVLIAKQLGIKPAGIRLCLKFLVHSGAWNMLDIFMVGVLVTSVKLQDSATLIPGIGILSFTCLIIILTIINTHLDFNKLWNWYDPSRLFINENEDQLCSCKTCQASIGLSKLKDQNSCPRCNASITYRIQHSLQKTSALVITAAILYIPALALPIMTVSSLGRETNDTILSGVIYMFNEGMWFIGVVIFTASILVPILKLLSLGYLIISIHFNYQKNRLLRQRLFVITEFIGRWSMIDVFVITLLVALVQFGIILNIRPEPAALAFAAVVVLTMVAVETFDTRLLWDKLIETDHAHGQ